MAALGDLRTEAVGYSGDSASKPEKFGVDESNRAASVEVPHPLHSSACPNDPQKRVADMDKIAVKIQFVSSEREYFSIRIPVEPNTKQIVPRGSSADETILAISLAE
jgi:hypothetical protein